MNIDELDLTVQSHVCLNRAGITTVEQLGEMTDIELLAIRGLGEKCVAEIKEKLTSPELSKYKKPPLGVTPYWIVLPDRMIDLAESISRRLEGGGIQMDKKAVATIRERATEIICHCDTIDQLRELKEGINE